MHTIGKATTAVLAVVFAIAMTTFFSLAASDFEGVWKVKDTAGQPFEITLSSGGAAKASRGEGMVGTPNAFMRDCRTADQIEAEDRRASGRLAMASVDARAD